LLSYLTVALQFAWDDRVREQIKGLEEVKKYERALADKGEKVPPPPNCPPDLVLPWKDYK